MSNKQHQLDAKATLTDLLQQIDLLNIHPKSKLLLYQKYVLSKLSWHFTVADISKTWVIQNLDNTLISYVRIWLDLPISATISHLTLSKSKFGLNLQLPSTKFLQCQTVLRNALKSSPNDNIKSLWENTSSGSNIQYDIYQNTKQVLKAVRSDTYIHTYIHFLFYNAGLIFGNLLLVDVDLQLKSSKQKENLIQNPI